MFKKIVITTALVAVIGVLVFGAVNRTQAKTANESINTRQVSAVEAAAEEEVSIFSETASVSAQPAQGNGNGGRGQGTAGTGSQLAAGTGELSAEETAALLYMREEEKLAHDVYITLYEQWGLPLFQNISRSEQAHADSIKTLIDRYGLTDPASSTVGVFTDPALQALYTDLVARGSQSLPGVARGGHHGRAARRVDVEHPDAEPRRRGTGLRCGVRDVVELEVEEHAEAAADELAHESRVGGREELLADLQRALLRVQARREPERGDRVGEVEGDDDAGVDAHRRAIPSVDAPRRMSGRIKRSPPASRSAAASTTPTSGIPGSASSTGGRGSRNARSGTCPDA